MFDITVGEMYEAMKKMVEAYPEIKDIPLSSWYEFIADSDPAFFNAFMDEAETYRMMPSINIDIPAKED